MRVNAQDTIQCLRCRDQVPIPIRIGHCHSDHRSKWYQTACRGMLEANFVVQCQTRFIERNFEFKTPEKNIRIRYIRFASFTCRSPVGKANISTHFSRGERKLSSVLLPPRPCKKVITADRFPDFGTKIKNESEALLWILRCCIFHSPLE